MTHQRAETPSEPSTPYVARTAAQPQWPRPSLVPIRDFTYTHRQPQWSTVLHYHDAAGDAGATAGGAATMSMSRAAAAARIVRSDPLAARRLCATCHFAKEACTCTRCGVCGDAVYRRRRHHCRSCWRAVCPQCYGKERHVHPLGSRQLVCDQCAVPWALANLTKREDRGLFWGLYLLRRAGEMPCLCVAPICKTLTYRPICYLCGTPTVMTQPHVERVLRVEPSLIAAVDRVRMLDGQERSLRTISVDKYTTDDVERLFRTCFRRYEELTAFQSLHSTREGQRLLLSLVAASVSYEYHSAPDLTLAFSDVPYARLLKLAVSRPRYSVLESPGRVKYIAFPGTHNWRTRMVDLRLSQEVKQSWTPLIEGVRVDPATGQSVMLCGGLRQVWSYRVHGGFAQETRETDVPLAQLAEDVRQGYQLVLSGHSLGGAVAQLVTVQLLSRYPELFPPASQLAAGQTPPIMCVTMGAPLVGNYQFVDRVTQSGWGPYFHNLVYRTDIVPRLSCGDELTWDAASRVMEQASSVYRNVQNWFTWRQENEAAEAEAAAASASDAASRAETPAAEAVGSPSDPPSLAARLMPWRRGDAAPSPPPTTSTPASASSRAERQALGSVVDVLRTTAPQLVAQATGTSLEDYVDASIRTGRAVLAEGEDVPPSAGQVQAHVASTLREAHHTASLVTPSRQTSGVPSTPHTARVSTTPEGADREEDGAVSRASSPSTPIATSTAQADEEAAAIARALSHEALRRTHRRYACLGRYHLMNFGDAGYISTADSEVAFALLKNGCGLATRLIDHSVSSYNRGVMLQLYGMKE